MSREELKNFIHSAEHSSKLRSELKKCTDNVKVLSLAKEYGFSLTIEDLTQDDIAEKANNWFKISKLSPLRKNRL